MTGPKGLNRGNGSRWALLWASLGLLILFWALRLPSETTATFRLSDLGAVKLPARWALMIIGLLFCGTGLTGWLTPYGKKPYVFWIQSVFLVITVLLWAGMQRRLDLVGLASQSLRLATPIALGALAGVISERSGIINIAIEGLMLTSACIGYTVALYAQNTWIGLSAAVFSSALLAGLHAVLSIRFLMDQIISATVINILAVGITGFIRRAFLLQPSLTAPDMLPVLRIPWLSDIPILGPILFRQQPMVYAVIVLVIGLHLALFHTRWGLRTRLAGEHPRAADTLGINVLRLRYMNVILSGAVAGLGGAWFSLETVGRFDDLMTGGKGFISLAAMIFGKWMPFGAAGGALLFGSADALQIKLQISGVNIPYQFLAMAPYLITIIVLAGLVGRAVAPAADGRPYERD